jgi:hypothetical protein
MAIYELELDALAQTGQRGRLVPGNNRLHHQLVLVNQSQICQRERKRRAIHPQPPA